jgi:tetratricopeptide (TPR) repeat protein
MQYFLVFLLICVGIIIIVRPITILFHEFGHAIPILLFTRQNVTIFIGSFGNKKESFRLSFGKIIVFFRYNPFRWSYGVCIPSSINISINKQIAYILAGPLTSLVISLIACYISWVYDLSGFFKLFFIIFLGSAFFDFFFNLLPNEKPIKLDNGSTTYNDGYNIKLNVIYKKIFKIYLEAADLYNNKHFRDASLLYNKILSKGYRKDEIYRLIIGCYLQIKDYTNSIKYYEIFELTGNMDSNDFSNLGFSYSMLGNYEKALLFYNLSLQKDPNNTISLNNKGYTLNLINQFEDAIEIFDKAIYLNKEYAYSYNNRGLSKIKLGRTGEGLKDINRSLEIDPNNSYAYKNLGIHYFDNREYNEALRLFVKAKELDDSTHMINDLINETKKYIN